MLVTVRTVRCSAGGGGRSGGSTHRYVSDVTESNTPGGTLVSLLY